MFIKKEKRKTDDKERTKNPLVFFSFVKSKKKERQEEEQQQKTDHFVCFPLVLSSSPRFCYHLHGPLHLKFNLYSPAMGQVRLERRERERACCLRMKDFFFDGRIEIAFLVSPLFSSVFILSFSYSNAHFQYKNRP